ncbi:hypothetical protein HELRODRAFT_85197, partial [Helobdella robusta]|uniref:Peptidase metallopeptidase domain-containing protein n=1 Tax=Helobdella robusta TaxID=6412 RepID=T1G5U2_HELRO
GALDEETMAMMEAPRCSIPDVDISDGRVKRYYPVTKWKNFTLDYKIFNYPSKVLNLTISDVDRIINESLKLWSGSAKKLSFPLSASDKATIKVKFAKKNHGDNAPFDGPGHILGHGSYPPIGDIHFDDDETWSGNQEKGANLFWVAVHEFGHVLGLGHSNDTAALMYPYFVSNKAIISLGSDDVAGILHLYA